MKTERQTSSDTTRFVRGVTALSAGTTTAQAVSIAAAPILSRLYSPDDFGSYALFTAIVSPMAVAATARYDLAVQLPVSDRDAIRLAHIALALVIVTVALCFFAEFALHATGLIPQLRADLGVIYWAIGVGVLLAAGVQIAGAWANRIGAFKWRGASSAVTALTAVTGQIIAGLYGAGPAGLTLTMLIGQATGLFFLIHKSVGRKLARFRIGSFRARQLAREYSDMPRFSAPAALLNTLSASLPVYAITGLHGAAAAGLYALAYRVTFLPVSMLGTAVNQVFFREFTNTRHAGGTGRSLMLRIWAVTGALGLIPMLILLIAGEPLFIFVFGDSWGMAGKIAGVLGVALLFAFVFGATSSASVALRMQHWALGFSIAGILFKLGVILISSLHDWSVLELVIWFTVYDCTQRVLMNGLILFRLSSPSDSWRS